MKPTGLRRARGGYKKKKNIRQVHVFPKDCTVIAVISENYNQQSRSLHLRKLQLAKPFSTSKKITINKHLVKAKTTRKRKRKRRRRRKEGRRGIAEGAGLEAFKARLPLQVTPDLNPSNGRTREQRNSHN